MSKSSNAKRKQEVAAKAGTRTEATQIPNPVMGDGSPGQPLGFSALTFRRRLGAWYRENARGLPWRGVGDPYATWLSEIMLQQTRVATVIDRYQEFLQRFPTIHDLAVAEEEDVLALWSGLGYYRRARMLHRGAQFVDREFGGKLPRSSAKLRTLPGVGEYTAAAIASIAFGESVAVLDGNVERVLLRVLGQPEQKGARARTLLADAAQALMPAASRRSSGENAAGDHNQAMMELGATICLPRAPLCLQCPVMELCRTRGEHATGARAKMQSRTVAHLLALRKRGVATEVLLERRAADASLMAGMLELPVLPAVATQGREPVLRLRHAITNTNYYVQIFSEGAASKQATSEDDAGSLLMEKVLAEKGDLRWVTTTKLAQQPLTGLARKTLQRLNLMALPRVTIPL
jgi:A/G-specific adenine glycosylase